MGPMLLNFYLKNIIFQCYKTVYSTFLSFKIVGKKWKFEIKKLFTVLSE